MDRFIANMASQATDKTFLQGLAGVTETIDSLKSQGANKTLEKSAKGMLSSMVPNVVRQPIRNWDDAIRDGKYAGLGYSLTAAPDLAEQRADLYGKPMEKQGNALSRLLFPAGVVPTKYLEAGDKFLMSYNRVAAEKYVPERYKPNDYQIKNAKGQLVPMTPAQIADFDRKSGTLFAIKLKAWLTPAVIAKPTEDHKKRFQEDLADARREVRSRMVPKK
jgi:hypothetical protein